MDLKPKPVYEDCEVHTEWVHEAADDTLIAYLPGFKKEQLKVQVTREGNLRISGERPIDENKFSRFAKEIPIPSNCDQNKIRANFRDGMLHVKHPKRIAPADDENRAKEKPSADAPIPKSDHQKPAADVPHKQSNGLKQAVQEALPESATPEKKQTGDDQKKDDGIAKEADADKASEEAPDKQNEMKDKSNAANRSDGPREKNEGWDQEEKSTSSSEKREKLADSSQDAADKKENIEAEKLGGTDIHQQLAINHKQGLDGFVKGLNNPRKIMNMFLVVLSVVVIAVYLRNAIRAITNY